jgi:ribosome-associated protein
VRKTSGVCDYFVIAGGASTTQVRAISDNIARRLEEKGGRIRHTEGAREGLWVLLDCGDVVAHVFLDKTRRYYGLERLWSRSPQARYRDGRKLVFARAARRAARPGKAGRAGPKAAPRRRAKK